MIPITQAFTLKLGMKSSSNTSLETRQSANNEIEYRLDILASLGNQTISKSSSMYVIAFFASGFVGGGNKAPVADAGSDQTKPEHDGSGPLQNLP